MNTLILVLLIGDTLIVLFLALRRSHLESAQERTERVIRDDLSKNRDELRTGLSAFRESFAKELIALTQMNEQKLETVRAAVERQLKSLQEDNSTKLEQMRSVVDEKLHATLERRLGESFKIVSDRLEKVHAGLGEMQTLAAGVGDLKKVLMNVKTRGILGEVQLGNLLEQILTPEQYERNIKTKKDSNDPVEFAIKFSGKDEGVVYLPIDSKFPTEDYERLQNAQELGDVATIEESRKALEARLKLEAKKIRDKYIDPPHTTDFAILFLPFEGLYAEVLRSPGFFELLQRDYKITVAGPTTISALLQSFSMGFRTLAVEKRASEVWTLLGTVKTEFGKFGDILENTHKKLKLASDTIEDAARKSRTIERRLKDVEALPAGGNMAPRIEHGDRDDIVS